MEAYEQSRWKVVEVRETRTGRKSDVLTALGWLDLSVEPSDRRLCIEGTTVKHDRVTSLLTFVLAMVLHPEVVKRGQEELDRVVGKNILPTLRDRDRLPYIEAILKECTR